MKKHVLFFLLLSVCGGVKSAQIISGLPDSKNADVPFAIGPTDYNCAAQSLLLGAGEAITNDDHKPQGIMVVRGVDKEVVPLLNKTTKLNNVEDQPNPLFGQKINFLVFWEGDPLVVADGVLSDVVLLKNAYFTASKNLLSLTLQDLTTTSSNADIVALSSLANIAIVAVKPQNGDFGDEGSGLHFIEKKQEDNSFLLVKSKTKPQPLTYSSEALKINNDLVAIDDTAIAMHAASSLGKHYEGFCVTGGIYLTDGAKAVTKSGQAIIKDDAAIESDSIVAGRGANIQVCAHYLDSLYTSTRLPYLVVVGGVGDPATTQQDIYALPLTKTGFLVKKDALPKTTFTQGTLSLFKDRYFEDDDAAQAAGDLFSPDDADIYRAKVGGQGDLPGDITSVYADKDAVFVTVLDEGNDLAAGSYYSQALFDEHGRIQGWTDWKLATGAVEPMYTMGQYATTRQSIFVTQDGAGDKKRIKRTSWIEPSGFTEFLRDTFQDVSAGIQGIFDFDWQHDAFTDQVGSRISVLAASGNQQVVLMQSGADDNNDIFSPTTGVTTSFTADNSALTGFAAPVESIVFNDGVIKDLGPIIAAEIVSDTTSSWLVVGGAKGAAVLCNPNGSGWAKGDLEKGFEGLPETLAFKKLGNLKHVRKIVADNGELYILTNTEFLRMTPSAQEFQQGSDQHAMVTLASAASLPSVLGKGSTFADMLVSGKFALLATSRGLLRVGNGQNVATATQAQQLDWSFVDLPGSVGPVTRLWAISPTGNAQDIGIQQQGGNVYVLNAYSGFQQSQLYRFVIEGNNDRNAQVVSDTTMKLFSDLFVKDRPSYFADFQDYRNYFATDGAGIFATVSAYYPQNKPALAEVFAPSLRTGNRAATLQRSILIKELGGIAGPLVQRSATGSWLIGGTTLHAGE